MLIRRLKVWNFLADVNLLKERFNKFKYGKIKESEEMK